MDVFAPKVTHSFFLRPQWWGVRCSVQWTRTRKKKTIWKIPEQKSGNSGKSGQVLPKPAERTHPKMDRKLVLREIGWKVSKIIFDTFWQCNGHSWPWPEILPEMSQDLCLDTALTIWNVVYSELQGKPPTITKLDQRPLKTTLEESDYIQAKSCCIMPFRVLAYFQLWLMRVWRFKT